MCSSCASSNHDPINHLRVVPDFAHLPRPASKACESLADAFDHLMETSTALESIVVLLNELECKQIRADYVRHLLEPHVARSVNAIETLGKHI